MIMPRFLREMDYPTVMPGPSDSSDVDSPTGDSSRGVLVVEDDPLVRGYMTAVLEGTGYGVVEAATGDEALSKFAAQRATIIAVIVDHTLPNVSGLDIAAKMRTISNDLPIILTSGHQDPVIPIELAGPRTVFLQKPFLPDQLLGHLQKLVG